ncbi:hypothetical protein yc1106_02682 [Curvularia clavata]|uniref:Uncharacterized protein n=1 Tax=Curvularia clavata TaxID=95742 RepID=A0A9Q8Z7Q9_CURCL|nr:hypothetical protein yc1106_02682 [Curvularia clavata]
MRLSEKDQAAFKSWILPKLETISDADTDVLADYVTALVAGDEPEANFRRNCIESLQDFLKDNTESFVNDVIAALKNKVYLPKPPPPAPIQSIVGSTNHDYEPHHSNAPLNAPRGPATTRVPPAPHRVPDRPLTQADGSNHPRKRKLVEKDNSQSQESQDLHYSRGASSGSRPLKRQNGRNARPGDVHQNPLYDMSRMPSFANLPAPPPGPPPFDMSDPMAFLAMAAALGANFAGMPSMSLSNSQDNKSSQRGPKKLCTSYHERGFCVMGELCPFEHSDAAVAVPAQEIPKYDPEQSHLAAQSHGMAKKHGLLNGHRHATQGSKPRVPFSQFGLSSDTSNATLVVEQIPSENLNEDSIRNYFSEFGSVLEVDLDTSKQQAIIKFNDRSAANRAYHSPKAIFDNRFVKVYWYRPEDHQEEKLDREAIAVRQAAAQKAFEERLRKEEEAAARAVEIEKLIKEKDKEMHQIRRQIAELSGERADEIACDLHALHAEATELFDQYDPHDHLVRSYGGGASRGDSRGRGFPSFPRRGRGGYRGRGPAVRGRSAVKRLDNRPRRLAVSGVKAGTPRDEALRQYLLNVSGCTAIEPHPEQIDTLILTFRERWEAEVFLDNSLSIPDIAKLDVAWVPNDAFGGLTSTTTSCENPTRFEESDDDSSATDGEANIKVEADDAEPVDDPEADMDVADDVDRWLSH